MRLNFSHGFIFRFLSFMIMISTFLPIVFANLPPIIRSQHIWTLLWFVSLLIFKPNIFRNGLIQLVLVYGFTMLLILLNTLWIDIDVWNKTRIAWEFYEITVAITIISYYYIEKDYIGLAKLARLTLYCIVITAIMSIITATINPMYARNLTGLAAFDSQSEIEEILSFKRYGGGAYSFFSAIVCLFPILIYFFKNNARRYWDKKKVFFFGSVLFLALIKVQITANILVAAVFIIMSLLGTKKAIISACYLVVFIGLLFFIPSHYFVDLFAYLARLFPESSELYFKFNDLSLYFTSVGDYETTGTGGRLSRYPLLLESFKTNPFLGHYFSSLAHVDIGAGGHLFWMNKLAVFGLLGAVPFVFIIYFYIKKSLKNFDKTFGLYFLLSMFSIITLGFFKALGGRDLWYVFFVITPGLYYTDLLQQRKPLKSNL